MLSDHLCEQVASHENKVGGELEFPTGDFWYDYAYAVKGEREGQCGLRLVLRISMHAGVVVVIEREGCDFDSVEYPDVLDRDAYRGPS
eukprot:2611638-Amphidinium_carterae.1